MTAGNAGTGVPLFHSGKTYSLRTILLCLLIFGLAYGLMMGTYSGLSGRRLQLLYSAVKVPMLLLVSFIIALPSFFVINTLLGLRDDFRDALRALIQAQAALVIVLASLGPLTMFWYVSHAGYQEAIVFNGLMFLIATLAAQFVLRRLYRPLIARDRRHRAMLALWMVLYAFIGIQMGWVLRPFIGEPGSAVQFFREGAWGNAYVELLTILSKALS